MVRTVYSRFIVYVYGSRYLLVFLVYIAHACFWFWLQPFLVMFTFTVCVCVYRFLEFSTSSPPPSTPNPPEPRYFAHLLRSFSQFQSHLHPHPDPSHLRSSEPIPNRAEPTGPHLSRPFLNLTSEPASHRLSPCLVSDLCFFLPVATPLRHRGTTPGPQILEPPSSLHPSISLAHPFPCLPPTAPPPLCLFVCFAAGLTLRACARRRCLLLVCLRVVHGPIRPRAASSASQPNQP